MSIASFRHAARSLRARPAFFLIGTLSLALALGLTTVMFAIVDAVRHPYVPYRAPDELFVVVPMGNGAAPVSLYERYATVRDGARSYGGIAAVGAERAVVATDASAEPHFVALVGPEYFSLLGVKPYLGRVFGSEAGAGDDAAVVVSYQFWRTMLGARAPLDGLTLRIDDRVYAVIGVMPPGMGTPWGSGIWLRLSPQAEASGIGLQWVEPVVRLRHGVSIERARNELALLAARLRSDYGVGSRPLAYELRPLRPDPIRMQGYHVAMVGAALAVLVIACVNLANLVLARAVARRRELALRAALGASRAALVGHVLMECAVVAACGGVLGVLWSLWGMDLVTHVIPPRIEAVGILSPHASWRVFALSLSAMAATMLIFGLAPALHASNVDPAEPLKDGAGTTTPRRGAYGALVVAEVALSLVLLMGAGLLIKAAARVRAFDFGFDTRHLLIGETRVTSPHAGRGGASTLGPGRVYDDVLARLHALPTVRGAATLDWIAPDGAAVLSESADGAGPSLVLRGYAHVSPGFLRVLGIPIVAGRDFVDGDVAARGAVILDEGAAKVLWPHGGAVGRMIKLGGETSHAPWLPVVGVARSVWLSFSDDPYLERQPTVYVVQPGVGSRSQEVVVRGGARDGETSLAVQQVFRTTPEIGAAHIATWDSVFDESVVARRFVAEVFAALGVFGLALAAVGLYGVLAYSVTRRTREMGVRLALGATRGALARVIVREGIVLVLAGTAVGAFVAMWGAPLLDAWLYDVSPTDVVALVSAEAVLLGAAVLACLAPAIQAARADPLEVLRAS